jgi:23S rRNA pseudouridine955/2504/2580 synthase
VNKYDPQTYTVAQDDAGRRIDRIVRKMFPSLPLAGVYSLLRKKRITVNGRKVSPDTTVAYNDTIEVNASITIGEHNQKESPSVGPEKKLPKRIIVYENDDILALNKPHGILTHGSGSLDELVLDYLGGTIPESLSFKPGPANRLDRNTTGLVLFSKSLQGAKTLTSSLASGGCEKFYIGIFKGQINGAEKWEDKVIRDTFNKKTVVSEAPDAKTAITDIFPIAPIGRNTCALCIIRTGRTHQIRIQASIHGHPLSGDSKYGGGHEWKQYVLHSFGIRFPKKESIGVEFLFAPLPARSLDLIGPETGSGLADKVFAFIRHRVMKEHPGI